MVHPILDRYYERDPCHVRSSAFVQAKGLVSNEKAPSPAHEPPQSGFEGYRRLAAQSIGSGSRSPDLSRRSSTPVSVREANVPLR